MHLVAIGCERFNGQEGDVQLVALDRGDMISRSAFDDVNRPGDLGGIRVLVTPP